MGKDNKNEIRISSMIGQKLHMNMKIMAAYTGLNVTELVAYAVRSEVERFNKSKPELKEVIAAIYMTDTPSESLYRTPANDTTEKPDSDTDKVMTD